MSKQEIEDWTEEDLPEKNGRQKRMSGIWIWMVLLLILLDLGAMAFFLQEGYVRRHFLSGTTVNGQDVSGMTADEVRKQISRETQDYTLLISERSGDGSDPVKEAISGSEIGLEVSFDDSLERALHAQTSGRWIKRLGGQTALTMSTMLRYDETAFQLKVKQLKCFESSFIHAPQDASISSYQSGIGYQVVPEVEGNTPVEEGILSALSAAVLKLRTTVNLDKVNGAYVEPAIRVADSGLQERVDKMNFFANIRIVYHFDDQTEVLDGEKIHQWIVVKDDGEVTLNTAGSDEFVVYLRKKYATIYSSRTFMTSYGVEVEFPAEQGGDYGWWMNWSQEQEELKAMLLAGISGDREPLYFQRAASHGEHDYGNTYVEVNVTAQHVFFYKNGVLWMESDCVTGNANRGNDTPDGVYVIKYKERNATLEGENYSSPVSFWMPFNGNIGLHDATWRSEFGNDLYLSSGSHGCVNLPYAFAKELYSLVQGKDEDKGLVAGTPVIVYHLEGTESDSSTYQDEFDIAQATIDAIDYIGTVQKTKECEKRIKRARDLYDDLSGSGKSYVVNYDVLLEAEDAYDRL